MMQKITLSVVLAAALALLATPATATQAAAGPLTLGPLASPWQAVATWWATGPLGAVWAEQGSSMDPDGELTPSPPAHRPEAGPGMDPNGEPPQPPPEPEAGS